MSQPYGFASREEGNCTASIECGQTFDDTHKWCCPTSSTCQTNNYDRVCCDSSSSFAVCLNKYIGAPVCANSSYTLYDNAGYFCCDPQSIGMRVIRGSTIHSYCGARTGFTVENATILQPIISSVFDDDDERPSSSSRSSKQTNAAATAGSALAGVAFFTMLVFAFFWWRKRKGGWPSSVRKDRKGEQPLTAVTPNPADDWEKDVAMQNMPMAKSNEPPKPAPMPFIREVTHFELPTDAPTRTSEAEVGWTEMSTKRDSRLPQKEPQEAPNARNSQSVAPPVPPAVPPKDSTVSPISPVLSGKTVTRNNTVTSKRRVSNDGVIRGEPRTSRN
ncbi:hypothetical protein Vi05172_g11177 [Venturia inaequalis]|nr:hypothetical protein Vi05172_g11177 [Venturia inaequalis]